MLQAFGPEIWTAEGPVVTGALGFRYPTRMAIIRLQARELVAWSPIALTDELRAAVDALGDVRYVIAPNSLHHLFIAEWKRAYPGAKVLAPPGLREKRKEVAFDGDIGDAPITDWGGEIEHVVVRGNAITSEVVFFHRKSATVIFTDLIQQLPKGWFSGWRALVAKVDLMTELEPAVPRKFRVAFRDRRTARTALERILAWPTEKVLMAHGTPVITNGQAFIRRAFAWLIG